MLKSQWDRHTRYQKQWMTAWFCTRRHMRQVGKDMQTQMEHQTLTRLTKDEGQRMIETAHCKTIATHRIAQPVTMKEVCSNIITKVELSHTETPITATMTNSTRKSVQFRNSRPISNHKSTSQGREKAEIHRLYWFAWFAPFRTD